MKSKVASILLSVVVAFGLWLYVINIVSPGSEESYYNIPLILEGESVLTDRGLIITEASAGKVNLRISGNRLDLSKLDSGNITIKADLSSITEPGTRIAVGYTVSYPANVSSSAFVIESRSPDRIYLSVDRRISKTVPVEISWQGSAEEGFLADRKNRVLEHDSVQITGPQAVVDLVEKAVITIDLTGQRESISQDFRFTLCDAEGEPVDAALITASAETIRVDVRIQRVKDLKLVYNLVEGGGAAVENTTITLSVDTIRVSGSEAALELLGSELTIGTIDLREITEDCTKVFVLSLEDGITNLTGVTEVTAEITLKGLATRDFLITDIRAENIPEGLAAEIFTRELTVHVRGPEQLVDKLAAGDIRLVVDLSEAEPGIATYEVRAEFSEGFESLGTVMDGSVSASLWEQKDQPTENTEKAENTEVSEPSEAVVNNEIDVTAGTDEAETEQGGI